MIRTSYILLVILVLSFPALSTGCDSAQGTLADYFGWQSLGGTWSGVIHFVDGDEKPIKMTFSEFDGETVHVVVESGTGSGYIRNETDADYTTQTKYFTFELNPFFGYPCWFDGRLADKYIIHGNVELKQGASSRYGYYDLTFPH